MKKKRRHKVATQTHPAVVEFVSRCIVSSYIVPNCTLNFQNATEVMAVWASHYSKAENDNLSKQTARGIFTGKHNLIKQAISAMQPTTTMIASVESKDAGCSKPAPPRFDQRPLNGTASVLFPSVIFCTALSLSTYHPSL